MSKSSDPGWLRLLPLPLRSPFAEGSNLPAIIHNSGWLLFDKLVRMALGLLVGAWIARYLGPAQFGELVYVLVYIGFFQAVANLGMDGIVVRDLARDKEHAGKILGTAFAMRLGAGILCWIGAVGSMVVLNGWQDRSVSLTALAGGSLVFQAADTIDLWFQSQSQSRRTVLVKMLAYLFSNGVKVLLIFSEAPLIAFAAVMAFDALAAAGGLVIAYRNFPCGGYWKSAAHQGQRFLRECWPFLVSGISIMFYMRIDMIMIKEMLGEKELGIYAAVLPVAAVWQFVPVTLSTSLAPFIAKKKAEDEHAYMDALAVTFRVFSFIAWTACITTVALSDLMVNILFGPAYHDGSAIVSIYVFINIFISLGVAQDLWLINERKSKLGLYKTLVGAAVCVCANFILIPEMGLVGAAIAAVIAHMTSAVLSNIIFAPEIFAMQLRSLVLLGPRMNTETQ